MLLAISFAGLLCSYPVMTQNLASGRPGVMDSYYGGSYPYERCFDSDYRGTSTFCHTRNNANSWIRVDLDGVHHI